MRAARASSTRGARSEEHTYGVNTGFGRFVSESIPEELAEELQLRLLRSHACGVGEPYPDEIVRAAMLLRANALAKGYSGARVETRRAAARLPEPRRPPARAEPRLGRGERRSRSARAPRAAARRRGRGAGRRASCSARRRGARARRPRADRARGEGGALARQRDAVHGRDRRARARARAAARARPPTSRARSRSRRCRARATSFLPQIHALRPLPGQARLGRERPRALLEGSAIIESHRWCDKVQDAYSLRCAPQVHGACRDLLDYVERTVAVELNAATDNPLVLVEEELLVSNGNFHGQPLAFALDALAMAVAELASISERRIERLVNPASPTGCRRSSRADGGLNSGFMIPQYVAAALVSENKVLAHPASVDSIPTSAGQEDHVSMGNAAGLKAWQVLANAERALAIELLAGAQAVEFLAPLEPGVGVARDARVRARALAAARRGSVARRRHRGGRGGDPRRLARRGASRPRSASCVTHPQRTSPSRRPPSTRTATARSSTAVLAVRRSSSSPGLTGGDIARRGAIAVAVRLRGRDGLQLVPVAQLGRQRLRRRSGEKADGR